MSSYSREQEESKLRKLVKADFKKIPNSWVVKVQQVALVGIPDMLACVNGHFVAMELKKDDGKEPEPIQIYMLNNIKKAGGHSFVVTPGTWPNIRTKIELLAKKKI